MQRGLGGEDHYVVGDKSSVPEDRDVIEEEEMFDDCEEQLPVQDLFPLSHKMAKEMGVKPDRLQVKIQRFYLICCEVCISLINPCTDVRIQA